MISPFMLRTYVKLAYISGSDISAFQLYNFFGFVYLVPSAVCWQKTPPTSLTVDML